MHKRSTLSVITETFKGYEWYFVLLTLLGILSAVADGISIASIIPILSFLVPSSTAVGGVVSHLLSRVFMLLHIPFQFRFVIFFLAGLIVARALLMACLTILRGWGNARFYTMSIGRLYQKLLHVDWAFAMREKAGHLQNVLLWDTKRAAQLQDAIVQFLQSLTGFIVYLSVALLISPTITLITVGAGGALAFLLRPLMRRTRRFSDESAGVEKELAQHVGEHISGFKTVKAAGMAEAALAVAREQLTRFRAMMIKTVFSQSLGSTFIQPFGFLFAIAVFIFSYYSGTFNVATLAATLYLIQKIFVYLDSTQASVSTVAQFIPFAESMLRFEDRVGASQEYLSTGEKPFRFEHTLAFNDVILRYEKGGREALSHISLSIKKRGFLGIVGPSGGGKTSFADLVLRLFRPSSGTVTLDGVPVDDIDVSMWRKEVSYVSQESFLMHASIADNIQFYDPHITRADIEHAARQAQIYDFVYSLPEGFDTTVGDRGVTLSGGQRQRLVLARSLARKPAILVLDEVTSALDSELEREIQATIAQLRSEVTLIVIAHRVSTVLEADQILVLKEGSVAEYGAPAEMLKNPDSYLSKILALQSSGS